MPSLCFIDAMQVTTIYASWECECKSGSYILQSNKIRGKCKVIKKKNKKLLASMSAKETFHHFSKYEISHQEGCMTVIKP